MNLGVCADICIVISILGFLFMIYLTILCMFDPDRLHITKHINHEEDAEHYNTAWLSALIAAAMYFAIGAGLFYKRYGSKEALSQLLERLNSITEQPHQETDYEFENRRQLQAFGTEQEIELRRKFD